MPSDPIAASKHWRVAYVPRSKFLGLHWWRYLWPRRITVQSNPPVWRWLVWNFARFENV